MEESSIEDMGNILAKLEEQVISEPLRQPHKQSSTKRFEHEQTDPKTAKKIRKKEIKDQIKTIYKEHIPEKLEEFDTIWEKYKGKEEALLEAVTRKYIKTKDHWPSDDYRWRFTLKHFSNEDDKKERNTIGTTRIR